jgi:hypothetical protein
VFPQHAGRRQNDDQKCNKHRAIRKMGNYMYVYQHNGEETESLDHLV